MPRFRANAIHPAPEIALGLPAFRPPPANAADRAKRFDDPVGGLMVDDQRLNLQSLKRRQPVRLLLQHDDQVRLQRQDGLEVGVEIAANVATVLLDLFNLGRVLAVVRYAFHAISQTQGVRAFR